MISFFIILVIFLGGLYLLTRRINQWIKWVLLLLFLGLSYLILVFLFPSVLTRGPEPNWMDTTPWKQFILFASMLIGTFSQFFYEFLLARIKAKQSKEKEPWKKKNHRKKRKCPPLSGKNYCYPSPFQGFYLAMYGENIVQK